MFFYQLVLHYKDIVQVHVDTWFTSGQKKNQKIWARKNIRDFGQPHSCDMHSLFH
jgi:hypothetical protein